MKIKHTNIILFVPHIKYKISVNVYTLLALHFPVNESIQSQPEMRVKEATVLDINFKTQDFKQFPVTIILRLQKYIPQNVTRHVK